ncbi:MAG TPA: DNA primase [Gemmatimonadales bacterium]|nr:DNA primase [Gemmatimonadales bacterium]HRZ09383.1 DNA primase [Gemmatimonadales bacterium]
MSIPDDVIEQVRDTADIVSIVGDSVDLKRTGSDYRGPCPFHGGTHRNLAVIPKKGMFYCYVCHEAGDVFSFFMKRFGMDYPTAVREVARKVGIVIPERSERQGPDPYEPLYSAAAVAQDWFARQLRESAEAEGARKYLADRGIPIEVAGELGLGFAPRRGEFQAAMAELGVKEEDLVTAGLVVRREDGSIGPRFRSRLLFPIHDLRGRVVAFGGRLLGPGEPKYLNSPETPIFHKGRSLYNLHFARNAIRREESALVVEGYFDVLRLVQAGIEHVVAPLGTALTGDQVELLKRYTKSVTLLYDSDAAGLRATFRAGDELLRHDVRARVATLPPGEDPDTLVQKGGAEALQPILRDAVDVLERKIQILERKGWFEGVEHRREALDRLLPTIRAASNAITRELYLGRVAERSGVSKEVLLAEVESMRAPRPVPSNAPEARPAAGARPAPRRGRMGGVAEVELLRVLVASDDYRARAAHEVRREWFEEPLHRELFEALVADADLPATDLPARLSPAAQALWSDLRETGATLTDAVLDDHYASASEALEFRPLWRAYQLLTDDAEKLARKKELNAKYPRALQKVMHWQNPRPRSPQ